MNSPMGLCRTYVYQNEQFTAIPSPSLDSRAVSVTPALVDKDDRDREQIREVCDTIQSRLRAALERLHAIVGCVEDSTCHPRDLLQEYEAKVWPALISVDIDLENLTQTVRHAIDSCTISEQKRLEWLLVVNKFNVKVEKIMEILTSIIHEDVERVLELRERGVAGLNLKRETIMDVREMNSALRYKMVQI